MIFAQVLEELPRFTVAERKEFLRNVLELDEAGLSNSELSLVEQRLTAYHEMGYSIQIIGSDLMDEFETQMNTSIL